MKKELKSLIQTIRIYSQVIGMEFGIEKYAKLIMKKMGKRNNGKNRSAQSGMHQDT